MTGMAPSSVTPAEAHEAAYRCGVLPIWTVYERPSDYPNGFIARMHVAGKGNHGPTNVTVRAATLEEVRRLLPEGLWRIQRFPADDPNIVEVWL